MYKGAPVYLIKPKTFMNLSGSSVRRWVDSTKAPLFNCLVVVDAAELPLGELRIRPKGSSAGQNGIKNIIDTLKSDEFARLRVGIGRPKSVRKLAEQKISLSCLCELIFPSSFTHTERC